MSTTKTSLKYIHTYCAKPLNKPNYKAVTQLQSQLETVAQ